MPFTLRNLKEDLPDVGSNFDGAPDLEFRLATEALELEESGLSYQRRRRRSTRSCSSGSETGAWTKTAGNRTNPKGTINREIRGRG